MAPVPAATDRRLGAIGVDLNADHLAVTETDSSGNWLRSWRVPLVTYGKTGHQAEALIGDAVAGVVEHARQAGKPVVIERLDFKQKKAALEGESRRYSRMLSSFSYGKVKAYFISRGYRQGVEVHQVNPAFSSVIGRVKFMERYGLSVHQAAALVLARRLLGCFERIPRRRECPNGRGGHVAFTVPARKRVKRVKHVWTYWGAISGQLRPALAAQHRRWGGRETPPPIRFRLSTRLRPGWWLERGPVRCSRARFPGEIPGQSRPELLGRRRFPLRAASQERPTLVLLPKSTFFTTAFKPGVAAQAAWHNFCIWLNRQPGRASLAFAD